MPNLEEKVEDIKEKIDKKLKNVKGYEYYNDYNRSISA